MKLYNTFSGKKETLGRPKGRPLNLFVCGPTVYDYSHIGHARTYIVFDTLVKFLRSQGYKILYLQNITDVDDKIIKRSRQQNKNPFSLARFFEREYYSDMKLLGVNSVNRYARASEYIKEIQEQISILIKKGYAYQTKNGVYFEVKKFKDYGKLSRQNLEALRPGWRIEPDPQKKDPLDFALWKITRKDAKLLEILNTKQREKNIRLIIIDGEPAWRSPWGWGRPGWHIEDTAITQKFFGPQYDLHGGAAELKFPHHESEIAQQEAASNKKPFVKIWLHTGLLLVKKEKMSKSLGNFITIRDFLKQSKKFEGANLLRWIILSHHYRSPIDYNEKLVEQVEKSFLTIKEFLGKIQFIKKSRSRDKSRETKVRERESRISVEKYEKLFKQAINDDFNTPKAIAAIFEIISSLQNKIWQLSPSPVKKVEDFIIEKLKIFGIIIKPEKIPQKITGLATQRERLRSNQQFIQADYLRKKIEALGYRVEDTSFGPLVQKNF